MRAFIRAHWKALLAIVLLILLALATVNPGAARPARAVTLPARLRAHVEAIASQEHNTTTTVQLDAVARYIEHVLADAGYRVRRQTDAIGTPAVRNLEVTLANLAAGTQPVRRFIIGARYDLAQGDNNDFGTAAVLELARLLKDLHPGQGTEVRFVFVVSTDPQSFTDADTKNFIAYAGTLTSSHRVRDALSAFRAASDAPARGLAVPDYVQGVTLSGRTATRRADGPAMTITNTAILPYPYHSTIADGDADATGKTDYASLARVVTALVRTITALAGQRQG